MSMEEFRIVEIGFTGAGKTTYMACMYGVLQRPVYGFTLKAGEEEHNRLIQLYNSIMAGKYPLPSQQRSEYRFQLCYQGNPVVNFVWADYRGSALIEPHNSRDGVAASVFEDIKNADGIIFFCDSQQIKLGTVTKSEIRRATSLVNQALSQIKAKISLAIIFTKSDLIDNFSKSFLFPIENLLGVIEVSDFVSGVLIPVACNSRKLLNVEFPTLFALEIAIKSRVGKLQLELDSLKKQKQEQQSLWQENYKKSSGFFGWIRDVSKEYIFDEESYRQKADKWWGKLKSTEAQVRQRYDTIKPLVEPAEALSRYTQKLPSIRKGQNLDDYVKELERLKHGWLAKILYDFRQYFS